MGSDLLPSGTCASIGRGGSNALAFDQNAIASAPPTIVPHPAYRVREPDQSLD